MQEVRLRVGEAYTVQLSGLMSGGMDWTYTVEGDEEAVDVSNVALPAPPSLALGSAVREQRLAIHALHPGKATIRFALRRTFDKAAPAEKEEAVTVNVRA